MTWTATNVLVRRSLELAVLLGRPEASKEIEILLGGTSRRCYAGTCLCRTPASGTGCRWPRCPGCGHVPVAVFVVAYSRIRSGGLNVSTSSAA